MIKLAARNLLRHRKRTATAVAAIAFGVVCVALIGGFFQHIYEGFAEAIIRGQTGHVQIFRSGYNEGGFRHPDRFNLGDTSALVKSLESRPEVASVMGRLSLQGLMSNGAADLPVVIEGGEPGKEASLSSYVRVRAGRTLEDGDDFAAVVGRGLAESLRLDVGRRTTLLASTGGGAINTIDVTVVGIFETYSQDYDARAVKVPLNVLQQLFGADVATSVVVELAQTGQTSTFLTSVDADLRQAGLERRSWRELADFYEKTVELYDGQYRVLRVIVIVLLFLSVANAVGMSMYERTPEFATMMSLGTRRRRVAAQVFLEVILLALVGAIVGVVLAVSLAQLISWIGIDMPPGPNSTLGYTGKIILSFRLCFEAVLIGLCAGALSSLPALRRILKLDISEGLRQAI